MTRSKSDYALLWANGASFAQVYDMMRADIEASLRSLEIPELAEDVKFEVGPAYRKPLAADFGQEIL